MITDIKAFISATSSGSGYYLALASILAVGQLWNGLDYNY
jgi:hypothetical protein